MIYTQAVFCYWTSVSHKVHEVLLEGLGLLIFSRTDFLNNLQKNECNILFIDTYIIE